MKYTTTHNLNPACKKKELYRQTIYRTRVKVGKKEIKWSPSASNQETPLCLKIICTIRTPNNNDCSKWTKKFNSCRYLVLEFDLFIILSIICKSVQSPQPVKKMYMRINVALNVKNSKSRYNILYSMYHGNQKNCPKRWAPSVDGV